MLGAVGVGLVFASALLVTLADALIKKLGDGATFATVALDPRMIVVCALYFVQILLAVYIFTNKGGLAIYGNAFNVFYSLLMVSFGIFFFGEHLTGVQALGIVLALLGVTLLNAGF